jgi:3-hydroxyisobutyrate dehydrogenase
MTDVAFLGLGAMGAPMARRLLAAGHHVTVWNRTPARAEALRAEGADLAADPAAAVAGAEFVVTMLSDAEAVESVVAAFAPALAPDAVVLEMSTIGPDAERRVRALVPDSVAVVDAPVMGSVDRAAAGSLTILAGGPVDRARPVLAELGDVVECGEFGAGAARKLVLITAIIAGVTVVGEALALADRLGVPDASTILAASPLGPLVGRAFATGVDFSVEMAAKDLALGTELADLPVLAAARERLLAVEDQDSDLGAVVASIRGGAAKG